MKRFIACFVAAAALISAAAAQSAWYGRWEGSMELSDGRLAFAMTIVPGGALLDLPSADLYGYPSSSVEASADAIRLSFAFGAGLMSMTGTLSKDRVDGTFRQGSGDSAPGGAFFMERAAGRPEGGTALSFAGGDGADLPGTLLLPVAEATSAAGTPSRAGSSKPPLVILHAGLGAADRNGNNYNVPGRNDALRLLAEALAERGIASYRYDKRGSGASSWLVADEEAMSFEAWVKDLAAASSALSNTGQFSGVWLLGLNDGAIVAVAAANALASGRAADRSPVSGVIVACASADGPLDAFKKAVAQAPEDKRSEGEAIIAALLAGKRVAAPSDFYAAAFRPSFQPYLIEAFKRDLETELARYAGPCLIAQGNMDMQATLGDFLALTKAKPDAATVIAPYMNHVLKDVPQDVEENLAAFSDPRYPVSREFVEAVAKFIGVAPKSAEE